MKNEVKNLQDRYGEMSFNRDKSTEEIISITIHSLRRYLSEGQLDHIAGQMPRALQELVH